MTITAKANDATAVREGTVADRTLVVERVFKAPPERVFRAWTDPKILVKWWGPETFTTPELAMDPKPGGAWRTKMTSPTYGTYVCSGVYREVTPPKRLVITWGWETDGARGHETVIEVTFEPVDGGTKLRLVQQIFETVEQRDSHNQGWTSSFNDLEKALA